MAMLVAGDTDVGNVGFLVLDFETVTPRGRPPEPIEVAAMVLAPAATDRRQHGEVFERFIQPPPGAPITVFDTRQTGIREQDVVEAEFASRVLKRLDAFAEGRVVAVIAQNAKYESAIVRRFSASCEYLAKLPFLDTVLLAQMTNPGLANYSLDSIANAVAVPLPTRRHRALPDVQLTADVFLTLLARCERMEGKVSLQRLIDIASPDVDRKPKPIQRSLFE